MTYFTSILIAFLLFSGSGQDIYYNLYTPEFSLYMKLTNNPDKGRIIIGRGEAAVIALASTSGGTEASKNR